MAFTKNLCDFYFDKIKHIAKKKGDAKEFTNNTGIIWAEITPISTMKMRHTGALWNILKLKVVQMSLKWSCAEYLTRLDLEVYGQSVKQRFRFTSLCHNCCALMTVLIKTTADLIFLGDFNWQLVKPTWFSTVRPKSVGTLQMQLQALST